MINSTDRLSVLLVLGNNAPVPDVMGGGTERLVTMLADQNEVDNKIKLIIVSPYNKSAQHKSLEYKNTRFIYLKKNNLLVKARNAFVFLWNKCLGKNELKKGYYSRIFDFINPKDIDIAVDENGYVPEIKYLTEGLGRDKVIARIHWNVDPVDRGVDNLYGGIIGVSKYVADFWISKLPNDKIKKMVVYSAVDEKRFIIHNTHEIRRSIREQYGIPTDCGLFIYCGRLDPQKGVLELIKAFKHLSGEDWSLLIVGGTNFANSTPLQYEENLKKIAEDDNRIKFTGYIANNDLYKYYASSDVQIIPTLVEEAAGLVAIEGMLLGLPIIAADAGGLPEYLSDKCAMIIKRDGDFVDALYGAMKVLANNPLKRIMMSEAAIENVKRFSQKKYYDDFFNTLDLYYKDQM